MLDVDPRDTPTFKLVVSLIEEFFEHREPLTPDTDLMSLPADDAEDLEWALEALQKSLRLEWPTERDGLGGTRRLQLFLPETLTIDELCVVVDAGAWPMKWTRSGQRLLPLIRP